MRARNPLIAVWLIGLLASLGCGDKPQQRLLRLGELIRLDQLPPQVLEISDSVDTEGRVFEVSIDAARYARLEIRARGDATMLELSWKLAQEPQVTNFRRLSFPTIADGEAHTYEIDLEREPYWVGVVDALELTTGEGAVEILKVTASPASSAYRDLALGGESMPSLPAIERYEFELPEDLPRPLVFETSLGIVPSFDREGTTVRFRAWIESDGKKKPWLDEEIRGAPGRTTRGWQALRLAVKASPGDRLVLESEATSHGSPLPEGAGIWGNPLLLAGRVDARAPDLVVVVIDTLRADVLGTYGSEEGLTPNLDRLASTAARFDDLVAPAPWTLPSVATLVTGLHPQTHGAGQRQGNFAPTGLSGAATTLAETLAANGFYTAGIYHNIYLNPPFGLHQGYDHYISDETDDDELIDRALAALERLDDRRLFLYLHLFGPHNPYEPPQQECEQVARRLVPKYRGSLGCAGDRRPQGPMPVHSDRPWLEALYKAEVAFTDRQLGRLFAALEQRPNTVLLVTSDHGEDFWQRQQQLHQHGYRRNADHGHHHFASLLNVPGLLRLPGAQPVEVAEAVELVDFFPTLLGALGLEAPPNQGRNLLPLLEGQHLPRPTRLADRLLYGGSRWAVQRGPWKLVVPEKETLANELYHLDRDPAERDDVSADELETMRTLEQLGRAEIARRERERGRYLSGRDTLSATYLEWNHITKLRSLGYLN